MTYTRKNKGVCSLSTEVTLTDDGVIESVTVVGGCNGNLKGISALLTGLRAEDAHPAPQGPYLRQQAHLLPGPDRVGAGGSAGKMNHP